MKILCKLLLFRLFIIPIACSPEEYTPHSSSHDKEKSRLTKPTLDKYLTTTTHDGVSFRVRFKNGGDTFENMSCVVHWKRYPSKPSSKPSPSDLTTVESMRTYGGGTKVSTTFDKSHAGFTGGTYLYYFFECSNSRYTTKTDVTFCIIPR